MFPGGKRTQGIAVKRYGSLPTRAIDSWELLFHIATLSASFHSTAMGKTTLEHTLRYKNRVKRWSHNVFLGKRQRLFRCYLMAREEDPRPGETVTEIMPRLPFPLCFHSSPFSLSLSSLPLSLFLSVSLSLHNPPSEYN